MRLIYIDCWIELLARNFLETVLLLLPVGDDVDADADADVSDSDSVCLGSVNGPNLIADSDTFSVCSKFFDFSYFSSLSSLSRSCNSVLL